MPHILNILQEIRPRVSMYIGSGSITKLAAYLRGCHHALAKHGLADQDRFREGFQEWIQRRFRISVSRSWDEIIAFYCVDDKEALEYFWELLDEFLRESGA